MPSIPLLHTSQAYPFIDFLKQEGCPVEALLHTARLPGILTEPVDGFISEYRLWQLLDISADSQGIDDLGLRVGQQIQITELGQLAERVSNAPTLYAGLELFCRTVHEESTHASFWVRDYEGQLQFCRGGIKEIDVGQRHVELYTVLLMVKLVRLFAGPNWRPRQIWLQTSDPRGLNDCADINDADTHLDHGFTAIAVPNVAGQNNADDGEGFPVPGTDVSVSANDFVASLRRILKLYLPESYPKIELAADLAGMSVRTLQRRLAELKLSYSDVVQQSRFDLACSLLKDPDLKVTEIAYELAYATPGHFTRAFRRWAGITPREYRRLQFN